MSELQHKKSRRIPTASEGRLTPGVACNKEDQWANAFIRISKPIKSITLRFPLNFYQKLREMAFKTEDKTTPIIIKAVEEYIKALENLFTYRK